MPTPGSKGLEVPGQLSRIVSGGKALQVARPHLVSCADESVYDSAVKLVR